MCAFFERAGGTGVVAGMVVEVEVWRDSEQRNR
jgi:hypothetical protein